MAAEASVIVFTQRRTIKTIHITYEKFKSKMNINNGLSSLNKTSPVHWMFSGSHSNCIPHCFSR